MRMSMNTRRKTEKIEKDREKVNEQGKKNNVYQFNTLANSLPHVHTYARTHIYAEYEPELRLANICIKYLCIQNVFQWNFIWIYWLYEEDKYTNVKNKIKIVFIFFKFNFSICKLSFQPFVFLQHHIRNECVIARA